MSIYFSNDCVLEHLKSKKLCQYKVDKKHNRINFYVNDKIFAILSTNYSTEFLTLHFDSILTEKLQNECKYIIPCFENLKPEHWSMLFVDLIHDDIIKELIDISYELTILKMTKKEKNRLKYHKEKELEMAC